MNDRSFIAACRMQQIAGAVFFVGCMAAFPLVLWLGGEDGAPDTWKMTVLAVVAIVGVIPGGLALSHANRLLGNEAAHETREKLRDARERRRLAARQRTALEQEAKPYKGALQVTTQHERVDGALSITRATEDGHDVE